MKFLKLHAVELMAISEIFETVLRALPINPNEKEAAQKLIDGIKQSSMNIAESVEKLLVENEPELPLANETEIETPETVGQTQDLKTTSDELEKANEVFRDGP